MGILDVRYALVLQAEELDLEGMKEELSEYGEIHEILDDEIEVEGGGKIPVKVFCMQSSMAKYSILKVRYICAEDKKQPYVLYPIGSWEEKRKMEAMFEAG